MKTKREKAQRRRYKINNKGVPKTGDYYLSIDGNPTNQPFAYCMHYEAYMTKNQTILHRCRKRHCPQYRTVKQHWDKVEAERIKNLPEYPFTVNPPTSGVVN